MPAGTFLEGQCVSPHHRSRGLSCVQHFSLHLRCNALPLPRCILGLLQESAVFPGEYVNWKQKEGVLEVFRLLRVVLLRRFPHVLAIRDELAKWIASRSRRGMSVSEVCSETVIVMKHTAIPSSAAFRAIQNRLSRRCPSSLRIPSACMCDPSIGYG